MNHTLETINDTLDVLTFEDTATNHEDARKGSALAMAKWANDNNVGGHNDWVLPDKETLFDLCQFVHKENKWYWSSSPYVGYSYNAWNVNFYNGGVYGSNYRSYGSYVRLVRASQLKDIAMAAVNKRLGVEK
jgi:Protein of unknown function (DUF1566)